MKMLLQIHVNKKKKLEIMMNAMYYFMREIIKMKKTGFINNRKTCILNFRLLI